MSFHCMGPFRPRIRAGAWNFEKGLAPLALVRQIVKTARFAIPILRLLNCCGDCQTGTAGNCTLPCPPDIQAAHVSGNWRGCVQWMFLKVFDITLSELKDPGAAVHLTTPR